MSAQLAQALKELIASLDFANEGCEEPSIGPGYENGDGIECGTRIAAACADGLAVLAAFEAAPQQEPMSDDAIKDLMRETGTEGYPEDVRRLVHALQARSVAAPQQAQAPGWQPIETAPMDGTWILAYRVIKGAPEMRTACWGHGILGEHRWGGASWSYPDRFGPTHWMPLPAAPQQGSKS